MISRHVTGYHMANHMTRVVIVTTHVTLLGCVIPIILALDPNSRPVHQKAMESNGIHTDNNFLNSQTVSMVTDSAWIPSRPDGAMRYADMDAGWSRCPPACLCDLHTRTVRCHRNQDRDDQLDNGHRSVPRNLPDNIVSLNLSQCDNRSLSENGKYLTEYTTDYSPAENTTDNYTSESVSQIPSFSLQGLSDLSNLQILDLSCNNIQVHNIRQVPRSLTHLYLQNNRLARLDLQSLVDTLPQLVHADISGNQLEELRAGANGAFNESLAYTLGAFNDTEPGTSSLAELLLSGNRLQHLPSTLCSQLPMLKALYLSDNHLRSLPPHTFTHCSALRYLSLANNPLTDLPSASFTGLSGLRHLDLSGLAIRAVHMATLEGLGSLRTLDLSRNTLLHVIHAHAFSYLTNLNTLDLRHCNLNTLHEGTLDGLQSHIHLAGNPWQCNCNLHWLLFPGNASYPHDNPVCTQPIQLMDYSFSQVPENDTCVDAFIVNITEFAFFKVGSEAILDCAAYGDPAPVIVWTTPRKLVFRHDPATVDYERLDPADPRYHAEHPWHDHGAYMHEGDYERVHLLPNGSLYIDYVSRADGGVYTCEAANAQARDSAQVRMYLDTGLASTVLWTMLVGLCATGGFLLFGILVGIIRNIVSKCQIRHKEDNNRKFKGMLHSISDYKAAQMDKLTAYKTEKIGQLSAFKNSKMDKLSSLSRPSLVNAVHHMTSMREHYSQQIDVIRDNCTGKAERLRENYVERVQRFRDYRSHKVGKLRGYKEEKVERMRDNYTVQVHRVREYGSVQMARLRSSYKLQQHYLLKLYELLDIANCMTVLEAECMRTESMLFDDTFMSQLGDHPVHISINLTDTDDEDDGSYYVTASSQSDVSIANDVIHESISDDLEPEELNFNDIKIEPFPPYFNFLEAITMETQKHHKMGDAKAKKQKRKSKKEKKKKTQETTSIPQKQPSRKSKSAQRKAQVKARRCQGSDDSETDNEQRVARVTAENETSPRKHCRARSKPPPFRARNSSDEIQLSVHRPLVHLRDRSLFQTGHMADYVNEQIAYPHVFLSPSLTLSLKSHLDEETQSSLYESAHASREQSPQLRDRAFNHCNTGADSPPTGDTSLFQTKCISDSICDGLSNQYEVSPSHDQNTSCYRDVNNVCDTETIPRGRESTTGLNQYSSGLRANANTEGGSLTDGVGEVRTNQIPSGTASRDCAYVSHDHAHAPQHCDAAQSGQWHTESGAERHREHEKNRSDPHRDRAGHGEGESSV